LFQRGIGFFAFYTNKDSYGKRQYKTVEEFFSADVRQLFFVLIAGKVVGTSPATRIL
jgi:predicted acetyltransferase